MPTVHRKDIDNASALITVVLKKDDLKPKIDSQLRRFRNQASIKGFRQGQAPMEYVKKLYGPTLVSDTFNELLSKELQQFLRESKLEVLGQPLPTENQNRYSFKIDKLEDEYVVEFEVGFVPSFEIQGLDKGESFERLTISNLDELAETDLEYARKRMGNRVSSESDIQEKDFLRIAACELEGNDIKPDGWATTITLLVENVPDEATKAEFLGRKKGDTIRFNARLLEKDTSEAHFRKYLLSLPEDDNRIVGDWFEGVIEEVSRVEKADLDEDFFKKYFGEGVSDKDGAMETLKKNIAQFYLVRANALLMRQFQARLMDLNQMDLPQNFLKRWLAFNNENLTTEQIESEFPAFVDNLRWSILRDRIKEMFALEVEEAELREAYAVKVRNYFQAELPDHIIDSTIDRLMQDKEKVEETRRDLETDKVFSAIQERVTITEKAVSSEEFHKILDAVTKKAEVEQNEDAGIRGAMV